MMNEQYLDRTLETLKSSGIDFAAALPDAWVVDVIREIETDDEIDYMPVCNEGIGVSACVGAWFGGKKPVMIMENSGFRTGAEALARLNIGSGGGGGHHGVGVLLLASYRGDIGETKFYAKSSGITCEPLLDALRIPYIVVRDGDRLEPSIRRAARTAFTEVTPTAVLLSGDVTMEDEP